MPILKGFIIFLLCLASYLLPFRRGIAYGVFLPLALFLIVLSPRRFELWNILIIILLGAFLELFSFVYHKNYKKGRSELMDAFVLGGGIDLVLTTFLGAFWGFILWWRIIGRFVFRPIQERRGLILKTAGLGFIKILFGLVITLTLSWISLG